jgi:hypothetical protein
MSDSRRFSPLWQVPGKSVAVEGVGSSAFYGVPVLGAVKIVPRVGGCILTAPALRRVGSDGGTGWYEDDRVRCRSGGGRSAKLPNVSEATPTRRLRPKVGCRKRGGEGSSRDGRSWRGTYAEWRRFTSAPNPDRRAESGR